MRTLRGLVLGAGIAYLFDPQNGKGRRAKLVDRTGRLLRRLGRLTARKTRYAKGHLRGVAAPLRQDDAHRTTDDGTVLQRIRSEALRDVGVSTTEVDVTVADGIVSCAARWPVQRSSTTSWIACDSFPAFVTSTR